VLVHLTAHDRAVELFEVAEVEEALIGRTLEHPAPLSTGRGMLGLDLRGARALEAEDVRTHAALERGA